MGTSSKISSYTIIIPLTSVVTPMPLIDFTLSYARRFYSSVGNPLGHVRVKMLLISVAEFYATGVELVARKLQELSKSPSQFPKWKLCRGKGSEKVLITQSKETFSD